MSSELHADPQVCTVTLNPAIDQTVDLPALTVGAVNRASAVHFNAGGKGVNVASCLADWGLSCRVAGLLGSDNAAAFDTLLQHPQITDAFVRVPGQTRTNIKLLDRSSGDTTDVNLPGFSATARELDAVVTALRPHWREGGITVLAGSLPDGMAADAWRQLIRAAHEAGQTVLLDTSSTALRVALSGEGPDLPDLIKPNRDELSQWLGQPLDSIGAVIGAVHPLLTRGVQQVIVSMGSEGALFLSPNEGWQCSPPPIEIGSSVGAGDAMVAGIVSALTEGLSGEALARRATAFAAAKLQQIGPHLPTHDTVHRIAADCRVLRVV